MNDERDRRWRLLLGTAPEGAEETLSRQDAAMDNYQDRKSVV